jgi:aldehyde dehydrogenase (NAD+)
MEIKEILESLGINDQNSGAAIGGNWLHTNGETISSYSPVDGKKIGEVSSANEQNYHDCIDAGLEAFSTWKMMPAPQRGEIVRQFGEALRMKKEALGALVSYEMGKSFQ